MTYEEIEIESMGETQKHIVIDNGDGSFTSFPAVVGNPNYDAFLEALEPAKPAK